jgi:putative lipoic acid-binding regulatory protein
MEKIPEQQPANGCQQKPKIDYPCVWQYKVIGMERKAIQAVISKHLGDAPYSLSQSRTSSKGKYISMTLKVTVYSDYHRLRYYQLLTDDPDIKVVL